MSRLLLLSTIITVVYSWEEFKAVLLYAIRGSRTRQGNIRLDRAVGNAVLLATAPASIVWLLSGAGSLITRLGVILIHLGVVLVLMEGIRLIRSRYVPDAAMLVSYASGRSDFFSQFVGGSRMIAIYVRALVWPVLIGIMLKTATDEWGYSAIDNQIDTLVLVAVAGLVMNVTITFLTKFFRYSRFGLFEYFRILLGIALFALLA